MAMALLQSQLDYLVCPVCHGTLLLKETVENLQNIVCTLCQRVYPVQDGLPVLIESRATQHCG